MTILEQYPFTVKQYGNEYGNPIAVARLATGLDEKSFHIYGGQTIIYTAPDGTSNEFTYTDAMIEQTKSEVRALLAACGWPARTHDMMAGEEWTWLVIKHARGIL